MLTGVVLIYACGLPWLALEVDAGLEETLELGLYPFVVGDLLKLYLAAVLLPLAWKGLERLRGRKPLEPPRTCVVTELGRARR
jgi:biotin transporter BioY